MPKLSGPFSIEAMRNAQKGLVDAARTGDLDSFERARATGADLNLVGRDHMPPLSHAVQRGDVKMVACMLAYGARVAPTLTDDGMRWPGYQPLTLATVKCRQWALVSDNRRDLYETFAAMVEDRGVSSHLAASGAAAIARTIDDNRRNYESVRRILAQAEPDTARQVAIVLPQELGDDGDVPPRLALWTAVRRLMPQFATGIIDRAKGTHDHELQFHGPRLFEDCARSSLEMAVAESGGGSRLPIPVPLRRRYSPAA
jgi:hypothetical protein